MLKRGLMGGIIVSGIKCEHGRHFLENQLTQIYIYMRQGERQKCKAPHICHNNFKKTQMIHNCSLYFPLK